LHRFLNNVDIKKFFRDNGLSLVAISLFLVSMGGQILTGWKEHNKELEEKGRSSISLASYLLSGHFIRRHLMRLANRNSVVEMQNEKCKMSLIKFFFTFCILH
jgi:hypothetical protein